MLKLFLFFLNISLFNKALPLHKNGFDKEFISSVANLSKRLGIEKEDLLSVMHFETAGTFSPSIKNFSGSGATGLIQFMPSTAVKLGTTTADLSKMDRLEQLEYVEDYLDNYDLKGASLADIYMSVLFPKAIGKSLDYVLFKQPTIQYKRNKSLDFNLDGYITKEEAVKPVQDTKDKYYAS